MARTVGQVQEMRWISPTNAYIWIGSSSSPIDTKMVVVALDGTPSQRAFKSTIVDALVRVMLARREVVVWHDEESLLISFIELEADG